MKDNFSRQSDLYAKYRPSYPQELYNFILQYIQDKEAAWDCGTGNGQAASELSKYFKKVFATDISSKQIQHAHQVKNIFYSEQPAEKTTFQGQSFDLITVAQAIHWFNFENFFKEVKRVAKPKAILAVWAYSLLQVDDNIDKIIQYYYVETIGAWWDNERKYVDEEYKTIPVPFNEIKSPPLNIEVFWSLSDLEGFFNTWSALIKFVSANHYNPVIDLIKKIEPFWGTQEKRKIIFPVFLRLGRVNE